MSLCVFLSLSVSLSLFHPPPPPPPPSVCLVFVFFFLFLSFLCLSLTVSPSVCVPVFQSVFLQCLSVCLSLPPSLSFVLYSLEMLYTFGGSLPPRGRHCVSIHSHSHKPRPASSRTTARQPRPPNTATEETQAPSFSSRRQEAFSVIYFRCQISLSLIPDLLSSPATPKHESSLLAGADYSGCMTQMERVAARLGTFSRHGAGDRLWSGCAGPWFWIMPLGEFFLL